MPKTKAQIIAEAQVVKNATEVGENTATRVGGVLEDLADADGMVIIPVTGTQSGDSITPSFNPFTQVQTAVNAGQHVVVRVTYGSDIVDFTMNTYSASVATYIGTANFLQNEFQLLCSASSAVITNRSTSNTFTTGESVPSIGIDTTPTQGSDNLVKSGGVWEIYNEMVDGMEGATPQQSRWIRYSDGRAFANADFVNYRVAVSGYESISVHIGVTDNAPAAIAFYTETDTYMLSDSVQANKTDRDYSAPIPSGAEYARVTTRLSVVSNATISLYKNILKEVASANLTQLQQRVSTSEADILELQKKVGLQSYVIDKEVVATGALVTIFDFTSSNLGKKIYLYITDITESAIGGALYLSYLKEGETTRVYSSIPRTKGVHVITSDKNITALTIGERRTITYTITAFLSYGESYLINLINDSFNVDDLASKASVISLHNQKWLKKKCYSHLFIDTINRAAPIPCQSLADVEVAARMGFDYIETNLHTTSDGVVIALHGVGGTFGREVVDLNGEYTYEDTLINSVTYDWITNNLRYNTTIEKNRTTIPRYTDILEQCRQCGISVLATSGYKSLIQSYLGDNWIQYGGERLDFTGIIMHYSNKTTMDAILEECDTVGAPYIHMLNDTAFETFFNAGTLATLAQEVHKKGCLLGIAGCYRTVPEIVEFFNNGGDVSASGEMINEFEVGNICNLDEGSDFSEYIHTGSVANGTLTLSAGQSVSTPNYSQVYLGKGFLRLRFNGSLKILSFGHSKFTNQTISSDGRTDVWFSTYFLNAAPIFSMQATAATAIYSIQYKASKV